MSTKTSIKRIAAVAAVALTLGGFSAVSAHAATTVAYTTMYDTTNGRQVVGGIATVTATMDTSTVQNFSVSGVGSVLLSTVGSNTTRTYGAASAAAGGPGTAWTDTVSGNGAGSDAIVLQSTVTGTTTITITPLVSGVPGTAVTKTITWIAATSTAVSTQYTTSGMSSGATAVTQGTNATILASKAFQSTAGNQAATIVVAPKDGSGLALAAELLTASVSGPGTLGIGTTAANASGRAVTGAAGQYTITLYGDGTAGTSTVTISDGAVVVATKTVTFVGTVAKAVATQNLYVAAASTLSNQLLGATPATDNGTTNNLSTAAKTPAFTLELTDSNGNDIAAGATIKLTSSDATVITVGTCAENSTYSGNFECSVYGTIGAASGASATVTASVLNPVTGLYDVVANALTFKVGGTVSAGTEAAAFDDSSYAPGTKMTLNFTATDSKGNLPYDGQAVVSALTTSNVGITSGTLPTTTNYFVNGKAAVKFFAPIIGGTFTVSGYDATLAGATAAAVTGATNLSVSTTVTNPSADAAQAAVDAANEATDAANAATDAANNAMDSADAAQQAALDAGDKADAALAAVTDLATKVSAIASQIASLSALVKKIAAKVKA